MLSILRQIWAFIVKGSCTTNHKQIGTLYMLLGGFSGIVDLVLSIAIRFELAHEGGLIFKGSAHMYNVVVTSRALVMIFFFVMPILAGSFEAAAGYGHFVGVVGLGVFALVYILCPSYEKQ